MRLCLCVNVSALWRVDLRFHEALRQCFSFKSWYGGFFLFVERIQNQPKHPIQSNDSHCLWPSGTMHCVHTQNVCVIIFFMVTLLFFFINRHRRFSFYFAFFRFLFLFLVCCFVSDVLVDINHHFCSILASFNSLWSAKVPLNKSHLLRNCNSIWRRVEMYVKKQTLLAIANNKQLFITHTHNMHFATKVNGEFIMLCT